MTHIEALKLADTLVPVLRNMLNEHGQMLQQHHTKGDEDFLISKTITAIDTALKSGEQDTPRTENSTGARTQQLTEPLHAETVSNEYGENVTSAEHDEWSPPLRPEGTEAGKDFTFGFTTNEPVKVDVPTEEMCDAARWFILARDSNIHTWGGLSRCIDTTIPYIAEKMRNDPQGHITKWDFADCVYRLMQSVATPNQVKVSAMQERGGVANHYDMAIACDFPDGLSLYVRENEAGGHTYYSDEVGCGVMVWDTCLISERTLLAAIEHNRGNNPTPPAQAEE